MNPRVDQVMSMVQSAWRFRWAGLACAWGVALVGGAAVLALPGRYDTEARVYVNTASLLQPLLEGLTVTANTTNQIELVRRDRRAPAARACHRNDGPERARTHARGA